MTHPTQSINGGIPVPQADESLDNLGQLAAAIAVQNRGWRVAFDTIAGAIYLSHAQSRQSIKLTDNPTNRVIAVALLSRLNS